MRGSPRIRAWLTAQTGPGSATFTCLWLLRGVPPPGAESRISPAGSQRPEGDGMAGPWPAVRVCPVERTVEHSSMKNNTKSNFQPVKHICEKPALLSYN